MEPLGCDLSSNAASRFNHGLFKALLFLCGGAVVRATHTRDMASYAGLFLFETYFHDIYGVASSFMINFVLSLLYIPLLFSRPDLKGLPYGAAWSKMIGSVAGALFCYLWWPMQFDAARVLIRPPYLIVYTLGNQSGDR